MEYKKFDNIFVLRVDKDEEILEKIEELVVKEKISLGKISGLGAVKKVKLGLFDPIDKKYYSKVLEEPMEIVSFHGNISTMDNKPYIHCHMIVSDMDLNTYGGHLNEAVIGVTSEIFIEAYEGHMDREFSEEIGINLYKF